MTTEKIEVSAYHFFIPNSDFQDVIVYFHRDLTESEITAAQTILSRITSQKNRGNPLLFTLNSENFPQAIKEMESQID